MSIEQPADSPKRIFLLYHLPALLMAVTILLVSSIPDLAGPGTSIFGFDKVMHLAEYGLLSWLVFRSLSRLGPDDMSSALLISALVGLSVFAGLDEFLQSFVPGRDSTIADFAADLIGIGVAGYVWKRLTSGRN